MGWKYGQMRQSQVLALFVSPARMHHANAGSACICVSNCICTTETDCSAFLVGRQIYRALYTVIASALLFPALASYPDIRLDVVAGGVDGAIALDSRDWWLCFAVAAVAQGAAIASLSNPSPLSLVPSFDVDEDAPLGVSRDDRRKLSPYGLTRITRHPLILPVVPWGLANAALAGWHAPDVALFGGLAIYAVAGCKAQDLRVESSNQVGTVFEDGALTAFYRDTSFLPFAAIADGRQSLTHAWSEVSPAALLAGFVLGSIIEWATLKWIGIEPPI